MTLNLADLVSRAGYFREVKVPPDKIQHGYLLRLRFDHYNVTRRIHPAYFPAAFLTLSMYLWVGGPIFRDDVDLKADLKIEAVDGRIVVTKSEELNYSENVGLYSSRRSSWVDGGGERTKFIQSLLDAALAEIPASGGRS